jgi:VWFA-related protein
VIRKSLLATVILALLLSAALAVTQESQGPRLEITGLNPVNLPTVTVSVNVFDSVGQPVADLTAADFTVVGELADRARVVSVRSFSDQAIPISVVLAVDTSSSMEGMPIESARAAATAFVESIGPNDPVAILTFSTGARVVQEFTTDRAGYRLG